MFWFYTNWSLTNETVNSRYKDLQKKCVSKVTWFSAITTFQSFNLTLNFVNWLNPENPNAERQGNNNDHQNTKYQTRSRKQKSGVDTPISSTGFYSGTSENVQKSSVTFGSQRQFSATRIIPRKDYLQLAKKNKKTKTDNNLCLNTTMNFTQVVETPFQNNINLKN